jgi:glycosyltransferase involved in cell wall biosynthesis
MNVVLFYFGLGRRGGIAPDLYNQSVVLDEAGVRHTVACRLRDVLRSKRGRSTIVNVYGCLPSARNIAAMVLARFRGQCLVWTPIFHPLRQHIWKKSGPYRLMAVFDRAAPHLARITHAVIAGTREEETFFRAKGAPRTVVIPPVVSETYSRLQAEDRASARALLGVGEEPVVLLIAAHSPRRKGLDFAAQVVADLRSRLPLVTFLIVGGGDTGPLSGRTGVRVTGWCPDEVLLKAYRSADILFVPSRYEQFSRATLEAWACELPVVVTNCVALAPTTEEFGAGKVVRFGDIDGTAAALAEALCDPLWRQQAGQRGRALVEDCFLKKRLQATIELYRSLA